MQEYEYLMDLIRRYGAASTASVHVPPDDLTIAVAGRSEADRLYDRLAYDIRRCLERGKDEEADSGSV